MIRAILAAAMFVGLLQVVCQAKEEASNKSRKPSSAETVTIGMNRDKTGWFVKHSPYAAIVPVTREASAIVRGLDGTRTYECILTDATFRGNWLEHAEPDAYSAYFVIDLNCK